MTTARYRIGLAALVVVLGCNGAAPPSRPHARVASLDGVTATGATVTVGVEGRDGPALELGVVTWPELEPVSHTVEEEPGIGATAYAVTLTEPARDGWYAVTVMATGDQELRVSGGGVELDSGAWALRFRPGSAPRIRTLSSSVIDGDRIDVHVELSEALVGGADRMTLSLGDAPCTRYEMPGETVVALAFECAGTGTLRFEVLSDVSAVAGGVLGARVVTASTSEVYRDPF